MRKLILLLIAFHTQIQLFAGNYCCGCEKNKYNNQEQFDRNTAYEFKPLVRAKVIRKGPDIGNPTNLPVATVVSNSTIQAEQNQLIHSYQADTRNGIARTSARVQYEHTQQIQLNNQIIAAVQYTNNDSNRLSQHHTIRYVFSR